MPVAFRKGQRAPMMVQKPKKSVPWWKTGSPNNLEKPPIVSSRELLSVLQQFSNAGCVANALSTLGQGERNYATGS